MIENAIYINDGRAADGTMVNFADLILDGIKTGETRTHKALTRQWVGLIRGGVVIGRIKLDDPIPITKDSPEYRTAYICGTDYDIKPGAIKYYYKVLAIMDFRTQPKPVIRHGNYGQYELNDR